MSFRKEKYMKVLAINSSTRPDSQSKTALLLGHLVQGMREAGAEVDVVKLREKKIHYCIGCFTCMTKTPGRCIHKDDMTNELYPKWLESDLCVYGTPLFIHTVNAPMKAFFERCFPVCEPFLYEEKGRWHHPLRQQPPAAVILSVAGFPAPSAFDALSNYMHYMYGGKRDALWAEIYRDGAEGMENDAKKREEILAATREAGRELVATRTISEKTLSAITQTLGRDIETMTEVANSAWQTCIDEGITLPEFQKRRMMPRPLSLRAFAGLMKMGFNPQKAGDAKALIQFVFTGGIEGDCCLSIENGSIWAKVGKAEKADLTVYSPFDLWMDILTGKADGQEMFMQGKYRIEGDLNLLVGMKNFFGD